MYTRVSKVLHHLEGGEMPHELSKAIVMQINSVFNWRMAMGRKQNHHHSKVQSI